MAQSKKKTVKELNVDLINLAMKVKELEDLLKGVNQLAEIKDLYKKIKALDESHEIKTKLNQLEIKLSENSSKDNDVNWKISKGADKPSSSRSEHVQRVMFKCNYCEKKFLRKADLNQHKGSEHPNQIKCQHCEETFHKNCELEMHLEKHGSKEYKCELCEKKFHLKWRLKKHQAAHEQKQIKPCYFFNNEEIGCMYKHQQAGRCKFNLSCKIRLCPFQHDGRDRFDERKDSSNRDIDCNDRTEQIEKENDVSKNIRSKKSVENNDEEYLNDSDSDYEIENDLQCETCEKIFDEDSELSQHRSDGGCGYICEPCGAVYKHSYQLESHVEKHCTKCYDEFSPKRVLDKHIKSCKGYQY